MKLIKLSLSLFFAILLLFVPNNAMADKYSDAINVFNKSDAVKPFFNKAYGYAVFPTVGKGGIGLGGAYGSGRVYKQAKISGTATLIKISIGFQLGGQAFSQIIFFQDKRAYSAVVITAAAQAQASTQGTTAGASLGPATGTQAETNYTKGMAIFVHTLGGLMYEASIGGQKFSFTPIN